MQIVSWLSRMNLGRVSCVCCQSRSGRESVDSLQEGLQDPFSLGEGSLPPFLLGQFGFLDGVVNVRFCRSPNVSQEGSICWAVALNKRRIGQLRGDSLISFELVRTDRMVEVAKPTSIDGFLSV